MGQRLGGKLVQRREGELVSLREVTKPTPCDDEPAQEADLLSRLAALEEEEDGPRVRRIRLVGNVPHPPGKPWGRRPFRMKRKLPEDVCYLLVAGDLAADLA